MALCLLDCLKATGLQQHYERFTSMGVCRAAHLSAVTMQDYPTLGICSTEDRMQLFHLIQFIKSLDLENPGYSDAEEETDASKKCFTHEAYEKLSVCIKRLDSGKESFNPRKEKPVCRKTYTPLVQPNLELVYNNEPDVCSYYYAGPSLTKGNLSSHSNRVPDKTVASKKLLIPLIRCKRKILRIRQINPKLVYESQPTSGYNYGLPLSIPVGNKEKRAGEQQIRVCVRKKPLAYEEHQTGETDVVTVANGDCVIVHESKEACDLTPYTQLHKFYFDQVFGEESTNEDVYLKTAYPLVRHTLNGGQSTCFAYGQTGAGKTHTMLGCAPGTLGLYTLAVRDIFAHLSTLRTPLTVCVSFFEIYCGHLYDLLDHRKRLYSREDGRKVVHIAGLAEVRVDSEDALLQVITCGTELRTQGVSGVNPQSSRSHALLQIQLRRPDQMRAGRIWFVDLAGSERASDRQKQTTRQSRMEGAEINQSLLALKECIRSLDQEQSHTPFRQSKLTQVLKDSFVGDAMTCMIANISPRLSATEHTLNTLRYADRVKELRRRNASKRVITNSKSGLTSAATKRIRPSNKSNKWAFDKVQKTSGVLRSSPPTVNQSVKQGAGREQIPPVRTLPGVKVMNKRERDEREEADSRQQMRLCSSDKFSPRHQQQNEGSRTKRECRRKIDPQGVHSVKKTDEENQRLRLYHQQLQRFVPSSAMSSPKLSSLSSSLGSSMSCSSQQFAPNAVISNRKGRGEREEPSLCAESAHDVTFTVKVLSKEEERSENGSAPEKGSAIRDHLDKEKGETGLVEDRHSIAASSTSKKSSSNPSVEPLSLQTPAERPLSPVSSSTQVLHTLRPMTSASYGSVSSFTRLQKGEERQSPCVSREKGFLYVDNLYVSSPLSTALTQDICGLHSETVINPLDLQTLNVKTAGEKYAAYTMPESCSYAIDPPSISKPGRDQQVAQAEPNLTFSLSHSEEEQINKEAPDHDVDLCSTTKSSSCSSTSSGTQSVVRKSCPTSKHDEDHKSQSSTSRQSFRSTSHLLTSRDSGFSGQYDNGCDATEAMQSCAPMHPQKRETRGPRKSAPSVHVSRHLESDINIQEKKHTKSSTKDQAQCHIVQAHVTQLKEMEVLSRKEEVLLSQQENMSFGFYIQKLEEIMKKKAQCVHNMRYKLQPYL